MKMSSNSDSNLSADITTPRFLLDDRNVLMYMKYIYDYLSLVPYKSQKTDSKSSLSNWADFFFMNGGSPDKLADFYEKGVGLNGATLPHQAFLLAMLKMLEVPRDIMNMLPEMHRDLYYRQLLKLKERIVEPSVTAISFTLEHFCDPLMLPIGTTLDAGQDKKGHRIEYVLDNDLLVTHSCLKDIRWCSINTSGSEVGTSAIISDSDSVFPMNGIRLFDSVRQDQKIMTGRIIISHEFISLANKTVELSFDDDLSIDGLTIQISGENEWHLLDIHQSDLRSLTINIPRDIRIGNPQGLSNLTFTEPVIRMCRTDKKSVPTVANILIKNDALFITDYVCRALTPFGHSEEISHLNKNELYLGITGVKPGQAVSLFWNLNSPQSLGVTWKYLASDNYWYSLEDVLSDSTKGLLNSGLWSVTLPENASDKASAMPSGCYWVKAEIEPVRDNENISVAHYPWLNGVITNAMTATLKNGSDVEDTSVMPLPAGAIRYLLLDVPGVKAVSQPWKSWGGKPKESSSAFLERVAQRLSHRNRALTWPDMVMLLKTMFPEVYDVMIPSQARLSSVPAMTMQTLVVMPLVTERDNDDLLRPLFNAARLTAMRNSLQQHSSLWQNITVQNPVYRNVDLSYQVVFRDGVNSDWAEKALRQEIISSFMPWSVGKAAAASLANYINYYEVVATLQRQTYVDHVVSLSLDGAEHSIRGRDDEVLILCWS
ncbi:hypothetical protein [Aeromonas sp. SG16]|uniref:hypothetical protein n=1 Tax=Aeromonas sp. SG16 TaxID=2950548 RepID=UPI00210ECEA0|nr:hypothetical protein [Aeromonas sp. SG16]MCQ4054445.1 hypothetical protein [Aeromonas sp. SG16]